MRFKTRVISLQTNVKSANLEAVKKLVAYCNKYGLSPFFVVHPLKRDIIQYLGYQQISFLVYQPVEGDTDLKISLLTEDDWFDNNILILSNMSFKPHKVLRDIKINFELGSTSVFAVKEVEDIFENHIIYDYYAINNKAKNGPGYIWGILGFLKPDGKKLLQDLNKENVAVSLYGTSFVVLDEFNQ